MDVPERNWRKSSYSGAGSCVEVAAETWWRKSSRSGEGNCVEVAADRPWRKSSYCGAGECVEVADGQADSVAVRDSKDPQGPVLTFSPTAWRDFVDSVK